MNKQFIIGIFSLAIGYVISLGSIFLFIWFVWNLLVPRLGGPRISFIDAALIYALVRLFAYDWVKVFNEYLKAHIKK